MPDEDVAVLYDGPPIWARMAGWLLLGTGGLVLVPVALANRAWWLLLFAAPLLLAGLVLHQVRLHIVVERPTGVVRATNSLLGLVLRERRYPPSDVVGLDLRRVAGDERERASDTWYLRLRLRTSTYTIGKYDSRLRALEEQRRLARMVRTRPQVRSAVEMKAAAEEKLRGHPESAESHYQLGLALLRSDDIAGARQAFQQALALAHEPLLRRMIEQRLEELNRR